MSADTPVTKPVISIRTFAGDLEATRLKMGSKTSAKPLPSTPVTKTAVVTPAAPTVTAHSTPKTTPPKVTPGEKQKLVLTEPKPKPTPAKNQVTVKGEDDIKAIEKNEVAIPPFHTFTKPKNKPTTDAPEPLTKVDTSHVTHRVTASQPSILTGVGKDRDINLSDDADTNDATIITDTKRKRFSLGKALSESFATWIEDKKDMISGKKKPKYTIPQADRRKGVIQKATSMTGRAPTADHAEVLKRLRANKQIVGGVPITKSTPTPTAPAWSTDEPKEKTTSPIPAAPTTPNIPPPVAKPVARVVVVPPVAPVPSPVPQPVIEMPVPTVIPVVPEKVTPAVTPPVLPILPSGTAVRKPDEDILNTSPTPNSAASSKSRLRKNSHTASLSLREMITHTNRIVLGGGILAGIVILGGISYPILRETFTSTTPPLVQPETHFTSTVTITDPIAATSTEAIVIAVTGAATSPDSLTEISFVNPSTGNALSAAELFALFNISVPATFQSSIVEVSLGVYRGEPWISFMTTDGVTAQGGMLDWENRMSDDLRPWYGDIVRDVKTTNITAFSDSTIEGRDVRILKDASGAERITYGFVTPNYLLISSNATAWLNLKQQWRTDN